MDELLERIYEDPRTGLSSSKLYTKAKAENPKITRKIVKEFLDRQSTNQIFHKRTVKNYYPIISHSVLSRIQIDLMDLSSMDVVKNKQRKWIFCAVDVFTRYAFCYPQLNKSEAECVASLKKLIKEVKDAGFHIKQLDSDLESAFL